MLRSCCSRVVQRVQLCRTTALTPPLLPRTPLVASASRSNPSVRVLSTSSTPSSVPPRSPQQQQPLQSAEAAAPAASDSSRLSSNSRTASMAFARWLSAAGVRFNSTSDNRPLFGLKRLPSNPNDWFLSSANTREIKKGEVIFKLPIHLTLAPSSSMPDPAAKALLGSLVARVPKDLWMLKNGLRVLYEYGLMVSPPAKKAHTPALTTSDSFFSPYISLLPNTFSSIPLFWNEAQLNALQYEPLHKQVKLRSQFLRMISEEMKGMKDLFGEEAAEVTKPERLAWAMSCVSSRAFQIHAQECANLPLIDMMNHSYTNNCKVSMKPGAEPNQQEICVEAVTNIAPGSELTLNYGFQSNESLLLNYGFILDNNPADNLQINRDRNGVELALEMSGEGEKNTTPATAEGESNLPAWKSALLAQLGLGTASSSSVNSTNFTLTRDELDPELIAVFKILLAPSQTHPVDQRTLAHFLPEGTSAANAGPQLSTGTSLHSQTWQPKQQDLSKLSKPVLRALFSYLSLLQSSFKTTLQEDVDSLSKLVETMLTSSPDPVMAEQVSREELAIRFRMGKKRILAEQMQRLQRCM